MKLFDHLHNQHRRNRDVLREIHRQLVVTQQDVEQLRKLLAESLAHSENVYRLARKLSKSSEFHLDSRQERGPAEGELDHAARKQNAHDSAELDARNARARDVRG